MSNGQPRDTEGGQDGRARVAYAAGCDPNVGEFDDWYSNSRDLVGGDDFAEFLTLGDSESFLRDCAEFEEFFVNVTAAALQAGFRNPKRRSRARSRA